MKGINKNKFLAELGRLLTFMYEEDKKAALDMYAKLFDDAADQQALLQMLVSPTRQAVNIARNYDATERKLKVESESREEEEEGLPAFVLTVDKLYEQAVQRGIIADENSGREALENQFSLFEDSEFEQLPELTEECDSKPEEEASAEEAAEEIPAEEAPVEEAAAEENSELPEEEPTEEKAEEAENSELADEVDKFISDFSIEEKAEEEAENPVEEKAPEQEPEDAVEEAGQPKTKRKARPFLLILYILAALPLTTVGVALLLIPTVLVLAMSALVIVVGVAAMIAAFTSFAVFADILIVLGAALILLALGLLLLWLFVWFVGGAIVGLIHGAVSLGGKWCYKEVTE